MDGYILPSPSILPLSLSSIPFLSLLGKVTAQKKAALMTGHRADMQEWENFRNDTVEILKVLQDYVLETITVCGVTFKDGWMLLVLYKEFCIFI